MPFPSFRLLECISGRRAGPTLPQERGNIYKYKENRTRLSRRSFSSRGPPVGLLLAVIIPFEVRVYGKRGISSSSQPHFH